MLGRAQRRECIVLGARRRERILQGCLHIVLCAWRKLRQVDTGAVGSAGSGLDSTPIAPRRRSAIAQADGLSVFIRVCDVNRCRAVVCLMLFTLTFETTGSGGSVLNTSETATAKSEVKDASASYSVSGASPVNPIEASAVVLLPGEYCSTLPVGRRCDSVSVWSGCCHPGPLL